SRASPSSSRTHSPTLPGSSLAEIVDGEARRRVEQRQLIFVHRKEIAGDVIDTRRTHELSRLGFDRDRAVALRDVVRPEHGGRAVGIPARFGRGFFYRAQAL